MSKAILVMDMPDSCYDCRYCNGKGSKHPSCALTNYAGGYQTMLVDEIRSRRSIWCPLQEFPEEHNTDTRQVGEQWAVFNQGWNACLDAIEGSKANE